MIIVFCADRNLYKNLPTTLNSLFANNDPDKVYLFIEDDDISYIKHPKIEFINANNYPDLMLSGINVAKRWPYMVCARCQLCDIIPERKIIYIDSDTIVDGPLDDLWNMNLCGFKLAMREEENGYFNSGVLLMDLLSIKGSGKDQHLLKLLQRAKMLLPDQDALNIIFKNEIKPMDPKFNVIGRSWQTYGKQEIVIRHYAGITKPWKADADPKDKEFWNKYYTKEFIIKEQKT